MVKRDFRSGQKSQKQKCIQALPTVVTVALRAALITLWSVSLRISWKTLDLASRFWVHISSKNQATELLYSLKHSSRHGHSKNVKQDSIQWLEV